MAGRLIILQDAIMPYRRPVYNRLAKDFDVWVVHSGSVSVRPEDSYREYIVPAVSAGPFRLQFAGRALKELAPATALIAIFDLRWPLTLWAAWRRREARRLLWGHRESKSLAVNWMRHALMGRFDGVIQYGEEDVPAMLAAGIEEDRIFIAPNTIDVSNHADLSGESKSSMLYVGRLQPRKRLEELLDAFAAVSDKLPSSVKVELVGEGDIRADLEAQAKRLGISERVVFHGAITDPDRLRPIFARAYAYVSPDNVGLGLLHAFAYGVPVVTGTPRASASVGFRHGPEFQNLKPERNGIVVEGGEDLQRTLLRLVTEPDVARRLGSQAYVDYSEKRSIDRMAAGIADAVMNIRRSAEDPGSDRQCAG